MEVRDSDSDFDSVGDCNGTRSDQLHGVNARALLATEGTQEGKKVKR